MLLDDIEVAALQRGRCSSAAEGRHHPPRAPRTPELSFNGAAALQQRRAARRRAAPRARPDGFNGAAALQQRRVVLRAIQSSSARSGFNGAAALQQRRASACAGTRRGSTRLQRGRCSSAAEGFFWDRGAGFPLYELQRGRCSSAAEGTEAAAHWSRSERLQRGRCSSAAEGAGGKADRRRQPEASTGPLLFSSGGDAPRLDETACLRKLQRGRCSSAAEGRARRPRRTRTTQRFNGAAALQQRRGDERRAWVRPIPRASTGPLLFSSGGRRGRIDQSRRHGDASTGPLLFSSGGLGDAVVDLGDVRASTGPLLFSSGGARPSTSRRARLRRFNGAAALQQRRAVARYKTTPRRAPCFNGAAALQQRRATLASCSRPTS